MLAFDRRPFGDRVACGETAGKAREEVSFLLQELSTRPVDREMAWSVLSALAATPSDELVDYHTARQTVWGVMVVAREIHQREQALPKPVQQLITMLGRDCGVDSGLPTGRKRFIYPDYLQKDLALRGVYSPELLARQLKELSDQLATQP